MLVMLVGGLLSSLLASVESSSGVITGLTQAREQFKVWYKLAHMSLWNDAGMLVHVNLNEKKTRQVNVTLSANQESALRDEVDRNIAAFCAGSFDEYHRTLKKITNEDLGITKAGYQKMRAVLLEKGDISHPDSLSDFELTEAYWMLITQIGYKSQYFAGLVPAESFYILSEIRHYRQLNAIPPNPFPDDRKTCGELFQESSFSWEGAHPRDEFEKDGKLLIADIRYMIKTNEKELAFPICVRVFWSGALGRWIPWFCSQYNPIGGNNVVF